MIYGITYAVSVADKRMMADVAVAMRRKIIAWS
jgi:hypothetical protein